MPPKNKFLKEEIIEAAFQIAKEEGMDGITIRKIATKLGSSIAPIYVNFKDVEELKGEVISKISQISNEIILKQDTGDKFLNIGIASVKFAKEYSVIFKDLIVRSNIYMESYDSQVMHNIIEAMKEDEELKIFTEEELKDILMKMRVFQVGLCIMATNESFASELTDEKIIEMLKDTVGDIVNGIKVRKNKK
ncbi:TetR/AcrR family transcriptional regulator [Clostridium sp. MSJ-11]|uniref:TetR/AcrR family transcriptional regulator n=1 Tax=Clostridium mobile TaxID=2841512 RepID=A0ABS6EHG3_9CLOT|nr:TetR/AcrR family transcriptional regulator [Clostridium mobile]MBU5484445.1 TetR/AcrR family transcriptional regulator [Clostridium mobile]